MLERFEHAPPKSEKNRRWEEKRKEIETMTDATGRGIDSGIKETVVAFNMNGIFTSQSCEGHSEVEGGHRPWPWLEVSAPGEPEEKFVGEKQAFEKAAREHTLPLDELKRGYPEDIYWDVRREVSQRPVTPEYQEWQKRNQELHAKVVALLDEFYRDRESETSVRLHCEESGGEPFEISSESEALNRFISGKLTSEERKSLLSKLFERQKEMSDFARFLRKCYFET